MANNSKILAEATFFVNYCKHITFGCAFYLALLHALSQQSSPVPDEVIVTYTDLPTLKQADSCCNVRFRSIFNREFGRCCMR